MMLLTAAAVAIVVLGAIATALLWMLSQERRQHHAAEAELETLRRRARALEEGEADAKRARAEGEAELARARAAAAEEERRRAQVASERAELDAEVNRLRDELGHLGEESQLHAYGVYPPHFGPGAPERLRREEEWIRSTQAMMLKEGTAAVCEADGNEGVENAGPVLLFMVRAFNAECEAALSRVTGGNTGALEERIRRSFDSINRAAANRDCRISEKYLELKLSELKLAEEAVGAGR